MRILRVISGLTSGTLLAACISGQGVASGADTAMIAGDGSAQGGHVMPVPVDLKSPPISGPPVSRERNPVLDQALSAQSSAALIMFLMQNPGDPFAENARTYLRARPYPDTPAQVRAAAGAEAAAVAAFDAARLAGTDAAWAEFLARYPDHPLAAEVAAFR